MHIHITIQPRTNLSIHHRRVSEKGAVNGFGGDEGGVATLVVTSTSAPSTQSGRWTAGRARVTGNPASQRHATPPAAFPTSLATAPRLQHSPNWELPRG